MDKLKEILSRPITEADIETLNASREEFLKAIEAIENIAGELSEIKNMLTDDKPTVEEENLDDVILDNGE